MALQGLNNVIESSFLPLSLFPFPLCLRLSFFSSLFVFLSVSVLVSLCLFLSFYLFFFVSVLFSWWIPSQAGSRKISTGNMSLKPSWTLSPQEEKPKCCVSWKNFGWLCLSQILSLDQSLWCGDDTSGCWGTMSCWLYQTTWHSTRGQILLERGMLDRQEQDISFS